MDFEQAEIRIHQKGRMLIILSVIGRALPVYAPAALAITHSDLSEMRYAGKLFGFEKLRPFGLHFTKRQLRIFIIMCAHGIDYNGDFLAPLEQSERGHFNGAFEAGPDQNKLAGAQFAQQPVNSRLIKRVHAALVQNDLPVLPEHVPRQVGVAVRGETYPVTNQCVAYLLLAVRAVDAVADSTFAVVIGINLGG